MLYIANNAKLGTEGVFLTGGQFVLKVDGAVASTDLTDKPDWLSADYSAGESLQDLTGISYMVTDSAGNLYVSEISTHTVKQYDANNQLQKTYSDFYYPLGLAIAQDGTILVADNGNNAIKQINPVNDAVTTWYNPADALVGIAVDPRNGDVIAANVNANQIYRFSKEGVYQQIIADGNGGINSPHGLEIDAQGNVYIANAGAGNILKIDGAYTRIDVVASGLGSPKEVKLSSDGMLYVALNTSNQIIKLDPADGSTYSVVAGTGTAGYAEGHPTETLQLKEPLGIAFDSNNKLLFADYGNNKLRDLSATTTLTAAPGADIEDVVYNLGFTIDGVAQNYKITVPVANYTPELSNIGDSASFTEDGETVQLDADVTIGDVELDALNNGNGNYNGASITLSRTGKANAEDLFTGKFLLSSTLNEGETFHYNTTAVGTVTTNSAGTLTLTFNENATTNTVNSVLQSIAYSNSSDTPPNRVTLDWVFNDGNKNSVGSHQTTVNITPFNDAPEVTSTPETTAQLGTEYLYPLNATDPEADNLAWRVKDGTTLPDGLTLTDNDQFTVIGDATGFSIGQAESADIALDSQGRPYVVFVDAASDSKKATVMTFTNGQWQEVGMRGFSEGEVSNTSIVLDSQDTPYVVYQDIANGNKATVMKFN